MLKINKLMIYLLICSLYLNSNILIASDIFAAPVPWVPEGNKRATGNLTDGITFVNLPENGEILIYTVSGNFVKRLEFINNSDHKLKWYGKNEGEEDVASGVYFWIAKTDSGTKTGKLVIIR